MSGAIALPYTPPPARLYRLAEWPAHYPTSDAYRAAIEARMALLAAPSREFVNLPAIGIAKQRDYVRALELVNRADDLFMALPAKVRAVFVNSTTVFLGRLREREVRDKLAEDGLMLFEGEGPEALVGTRPDTQTVQQAEDQDHGYEEEGPVS